MITSYSQTLKVPDWQKRRLQIFERDKWACTYCNNSENELQVHHVDYIPGFKPWQYPDDMLKTLCKKCHDKENSREELQKDLATSFKMQGFLYGDLLHLACLIDTNPTFRKNLLKLLRNP